MCKKYHGVYRHGIPACVDCIYTVLGLRLLLGYEIYHIAGRVLVLCVTGRVQYHSRLLA